MKGMMKGLNKIIVLAVILSFAMFGSASAEEMKHKGHDACYAHASFPYADESRHVDDSRRF